MALFIKLSISKPIKIVLLILLYSFILSLNIYSSQNFSNDDWYKMLKDKERVLADIRNAGNFSSGGITKQIESLGKFKNDAALKLDKLRFNIVTEMFSPYTFRSTVREIGDTIFLYNYKCQQAATLMARIDGYIIMLNELEDSLQSLKANKLSPELSSLMLKMEDNIDATRDNFTNLRNQLKSVFDEVAKINLKLNENMPSFTRFVTAQLSVYYTTPNAHLYYWNNWLTEGYFYKDWLITEYDKLGEIFNDLVINIGYLISFILFGVIVFYLVQKLFFDKLILSKLRSKYVKKTWIYAVISIVLICFGVTCNNFSGTYLHYYLFSIFFTLAMICLSCALADKESSSKNMRAFFRPLYSLFVYALILQFLDFTVIPLSILWLLGCIFILSKIKRPKHLIDAKNIQLTINLTRFLLLLSIVFVLIGLIYMSILIILAWLLVLLGIVLGFFTNLYAKKIINSQEVGYYSFWKIVFIGISVPIIWLIIILSLLSWLMSQTFGSILIVTQLKPVMDILGYQLHLGSICTGIYLFFVFKTITTLSKLSVSKFSKETKINSDAATSMRVLITYGLWCLYIVIALRLIGVSLESLAVVTGGVSVGLGFGLKDVINNFISGLIILLSHSIRDGDILEIDGITGKVLEITIRSTVIETSDNAIICIPNSQVISNKLINWTNNNTVVRKEIKLSVAYGSDINMVKKILLDIANTTEHVLKNPAPSVLFLDFADSSLIFSLKIWIDHIEHGSCIPSLIREKISQSFIEAKIEMPFPQLDVHIKENVSIPRYL